MSNLSWLSISSREIESSLRAHWSVYNVLPFLLHPPLPLVPLPSLCLLLHQPPHCSSNMPGTLWLRDSVLAGPSAWCSDRGNLNDSSSSLLSLECKLLSDAFPSPRSHIAFFSLTHTLSPFPPFSCLAFIIIKTAVHSYFPEYCLLFDARRKLQKAAEHDARNSVNVSRKNGWDDPGAQV